MGHAKYRAQQFEGGPLALSDADIQWLSTVPHLLGLFWQVHVFPIQQPKANAGPR